MYQTIMIEPKLIELYNTFCPRYTSYPTALQFTETYTNKNYKENAYLSNNTKKPISLYFHIPFCDTLCYYCACNKIATKSKSKASTYLQYLHKEITLQAQLFDNSRKVNQIHWGGGTPTFISLQEMQKLMEVTRNNFNCHDDDSGEYAIEIDPRKVTPNTIKHLRELGFNRLSVGIQDFDLNVQKAVNRIQTEKKTKQIIDSARSNSFKSLSVDLIYGLPNQTISSFERTLIKTIQLDPDRISIFNFAYLPNKFYPQKRIHPSDLPSPQEKLEILNLSIHLLEDVGYIYIGMDHFAKEEDDLAIAQKNNTLYRNFQGYATQDNCDLIGVGLTAISSIKNHYSQNSHSLEEYTKKIDAGKLAISKGIAIDIDNQIRKAIILELICHFSLSFCKIEIQFNINFKKYFQNELKQLDKFKKDNLLTISDTDISVTPRGKLLIRNICTTFDRYYSIKEKQFSHSSSI